MNNKAVTEQWIIYLLCHYAINYKFNERILHYNTQHCLQMKISEQCFTIKQNNIEVTISMLIVYQVKQH